MPAERRIAFIHILAITFGIGLANVSGITAAPPLPQDNAVAASTFLHQMGYRHIRVHDPSAIIRCRKTFCIFSTGLGIQSAFSSDLIHWHRGPTVFAHPPTWTRQAVPDFHGFFWAPDIIRLHGLYLLYYAVSTWSSRVSAIGLAVNQTLNPRSPRYKWVDRGLVFQSGRQMNFNAIDPAVSLDYSGHLWMAFGSFSSGIKLIELNRRTGKPLQPHPHIYSLAWHRTIEASYIFRHNGFYYLFVNWGYCCRGIHSTYNIRVGRSRHIQGPYLDKSGHNMLHGGGTLLLDSVGPFIGPGQTGIFRQGGTLFLHATFMMRCAADTRGWLCCGCVSRRMAGQKFSGGRRQRFGGKCGTGGVRPANEGADYNRRLCR